MTKEELTEAGVRPRLEGMTDEQFFDLIRKDAVRVYAHAWESGSR